MLKKINDVLTDNFDLERGTVPKKLAEYFGDGRQVGKLAELFDEENTARAFLLMV